MKITIVGLALLATVGLYSVCCTVNQNPSVHYEIGEERHAERHAEIRREKITEKNRRAGEFSSGSAESITFPGEKWERASPAGFGWDEKKLEHAKEYYEQLNADAAVIIQNGYLIAAWGEISTPIEARSMRKSFLGTLFGIHYGQGEIDLNESLEKIGITEKSGLTDIEKTATVKDLLSSRSGIFLPAAYDPNEHPARGQYKPGQVWHYNNWDFNALGTVFEKKTGKKIFESFDSEIARPLQLQDFKPSDTEYRYEKISEHPAYLFKTSARDDARIGLLWLANGKWNEKQIVSPEWMEMSTSLVSDFKSNGGLSLRDGYGLLFWIDKDAYGKAQGFAALGATGQYIYVNRKKNLVVVLRDDPGSIFKKWMGLRIDPHDSYRLVDLVLEAAP